jgi:hypothetical protein
MQFVSDYDALLATSDAPLLFLRDPEGFWRVQVDLARDGAVRLGRTPAPGIGHALLRDRATSLVTPVFTTSRELLSDHPRADVVFYESAEEMMAAFSALGRPPLSPGGPPPAGPRRP